MRTTSIEPFVRCTDDEGESPVDMPGSRSVRRTFGVATAAHKHVVDVTACVGDEVTGAAVEDGIALVNCLHTTCALLLGEPEQPFFRDFLACVERLVPEDASYEHDDPRYSDCERGNGAAHLRAALLGHGVVVGIEAGRLQLGRSRLLVVEWDGPRYRNIDVQLIGR